MAKCPQCGSENWKPINHFGAIGDACDDCGWEIFVEREKPVPWATIVLVVMLIVAVAASV